jgi:hypothetical protein
MSKRTVLEEINDVIGFASTARDYIVQALKVVTPDAYPMTNSRLEEASHYLSLADLSARRVEKVLVEL